MRDCKTVYDYALYPLLVDELGPRTIIEIGSGSSALWLADLAARAAPDVHVWTFDLHRPDLHHPHVTFLAADATEPA